MVLYTKKLYLAKRQACRRCYPLARQGYFFPGRVCQAVDGEQGHRVEVGYLDAGKRPRPDVKTLVTHGGRISGRRTGFPTERGKRLDFAGEDRTLDLLINVSQHQGEQ
jgi:hypothetical protein